MLLPYASRWTLAGLCALVSPSAFCQFQAPAPWQEKWDAQEVMIPMRDGVKLYTVFYIPKDKPGPFPILMERTPYGAGSASRAPRRGNNKIASSGYILAFQDVRGQNKSEGVFENVRPTLPKGDGGLDESRDTYDTVEWLVKNVPKNSGRVGLWGISYPGFYAGAGAIRNHPALKAVSPQAPVNDWFLGDDVQHRGAFFLQETFDFMISFDVPRGGDRPQVNREGLSAYDFFLKAGALSNYDPKFLQGKIPYWDELLANDTYNSYWKARALWRSFKDVGCAVLTVGGWFDKEDMYGALQLYRAGEKQNRGIPNFLVMGPWSHGQWSGGGGAELGDLNYGFSTSAWYQESVEFPFFERYLKGDGTVKAPAEATMFETGANVFRTYSKWPPAEAKKTSLFLSSQGLSWKKDSQEAARTYVYDPAAPTPYLADYQTSRRAPGDWLARDQSFLETRKDTVTFRGEALAEDLRIGGPITADLWVTTTGTCADFVVQLIDEGPYGGQGEPIQMMVRGEVIRAKFRSSFEKPEPFKPGAPTRVKLELNDALHTFRKGHRMVVRVQSSWFPIVDRNPNTFVSRAAAKDSDFKPATIQILTGGKRASALTLGVLPPSS